MLETLNSIINKLNSVVWGVPTIAILIGTGIFFTVILKFFQFSKMRLWLDNTLFAIFKKNDVRNTKDKSAISQFQAVSTALAATIGTGNIAGVATAISAGGPGAVFWMWISAFFGMMTSYAENTLGIYYRKKNADGEWSGGPMYYIKDGLSRKKHIGKIAKPLSIVYALFLIGASFGIGNMTQANSISDSLHTSFGVSVYITAAVLAVITLLVISGGIKRIGNVTEKLVPFMALFYIAATLWIFLSNFNFIPYVFGSIFSNAFSFKAVFGAAGGIAIKKCISMGFRRGIFSNEAGLGASVTVGSSSNIREPAEQGMWGIFQVFVDTMIVCTMTAFVLLSTQVDAKPLDKALENISTQTQYVCIKSDDTSDGGKVMLTDIEASEVIQKSADGETYTAMANGKQFGVQLKGNGDYSYTNIMALTGIADKNGEITDIKLESVDGVSLITLAFSQQFGSVAAIMLSVAIALFAFSTIIGWSFYGTKAIEYLFGRKAVGIYRIIFVVIAFVGAVAKLNIVWGISDVFNGLMAIPNLIALLALSGTVTKITRNYLRRQNGENITPILSADEVIQFEMEMK
ncbi:MAG: sodium:alanine symporter family protein [Faecalibacterium sp.]|nr:sodium:alanine symporter family protein [Ruminococcus sp.]MCM1392370.1 sodium:alanine symporter family protein [Ruminococcus sp.]MCM1485159.1 sodium:alanine symporter family protein [Faecalibacterium sp.]